MINSIIRFEIYILVISLLLPGFRILALTLIPPLIVAILPSERRGELLALDTRLLMHLQLLLELLVLIGKYALGLQPINLFAFLSLIDSRQLRRADLIGNLDLLTHSLVHVVALCFLLAFAYRLMAQLNIIRQTESIIQSSIRYQQSPI